MRSVSRNRYRGAVPNGKASSICCAGPFGLWMSRDIKVNNASSIMRQDDKHEQDFKPDGVDGEEVDGRKLGNVIVEEGLPRLGRRFRTSDHVFGHGSLRNLDA